MRGGMLPGILVSACIGSVLVWTMAAHDPYWRLFETSSLPAPDYESPAEIEAALASAAVVVRAADSAAVRPATPPETGTGTERLGPPVALLPRSADPLIAVPVAVSLGALPESAAELAQGMGRGNAPSLEDGPADAAPAVAVAPPLLQPGALPAGGTVVADRSAPTPVSVVGAPGPLRVAADEMSEEVLALSRTQRADVQRRLALAGFDPHGFDGVFGPRTRQAIADFQAAWGFPDTGYLDSAAHADLRARTEEAYAALASRAASQPRAAPKLAPVARERQLAANDTGGCARDGDGRIIERQSFGCDIKGLAEQVVSLGRNKLAHEESDALAVAGGMTSAVTTGSQR